MRRKDFKTLWQLFETISTALLGISVVIVSQMLSAVLDRALIVTAYCFAVAIPLLSLELLVLIFKTRGAPGNPRLLAAMAMAGRLAALAGIASVFFHFSFYAGLLFTLCLFICMAMFGELRPFHEPDDK